MPDRKGAMLGTNESQAQVGDGGSVRSALLDQERSGFKAPMMVLMAAGILLMIGLIVLGNALVIFAFKTDRSLRRQSNYFLLNLAIADFLVGAFCIPVYLPYILTGKWMLGRGMCKLWLVMDYLTCAASIFNIVLISYDRFLSVTRAVSYRANQGMTRSALAKMAAVWVLAFLLYSPAILLWEIVTGQTIVPEKECFVEFFYTWKFLLCTSLFEFFIPFSLVTFFNLSIYHSIRKRRRRCQMDACSAKVRDTASPRREKLRLISCMWCGSVVKKKEPEKEAEAKSDTCPSDVRRNDTRTARSTQALRLIQDKKVAKSLAVIVCVFGVCCAPYTIIMIICAGCKGKCVPYHVYEICFWLLWLNSAINPFLYPLCHSSFRRAFAKILCPKHRAAETTSDNVSNNMR
ncbi:histamine H3 receptor [Trichomycterus rosablanca]|uniref:histamine H3 receptor n=1 Tax=Trichomycterus rosablanca TaxID=2290929 RepID=UPI002F360B0A